MLNHVNGTHFSETFFLSLPDFIVTSNNDFVPVSQTFVWMQKCVASFYKAPYLILVCYTQCIVHLVHEGYFSASIRSINTDVTYRC